MTDSPPDLAGLARRYGTPAYVYQLAAVRRAHRDLVAALPEPATLHYSLKANPHPRLVRELIGLGCRTEISSIGELDVALDAGADPAQAQLTGPGKTDATIAHAFRRGVRRFSVDSPADLDRVDAGARALGVRAGCLLRVNADEPLSGTGLAMTGVSSQFGADASWIVGRPELFRGHDAAPVTGLHLYAGTNLTDEDALLRQFEASIRLAAGIRAVLPDVAEVNLGGGFGTPYACDGQRPPLPGLAARLSGLLDTHLPRWRDGAPAVTFESGRYLVGDSGTLLCRIVDVKVSKGQTFVVLDAGINHLGGMSGLRRLPPLRPSPRTLADDAAGAPPDAPGARHDVADAPAGGVVHCVVVGPLCTTLDTLARDAPLVDPRPGRLVAINNVGAYGLTASLLGFLGHPAPVEVVVDGADVVDVSRLQLTRSGG